MIFPIVASSKDADALLLQLDTAVTAVSGAMAAVQAIDCGRQYFQRGSLKARAEMDERDRLLSTLRRELMLLRTSVERQRQQKSLNP